MNSFNNEKKNIIISGASRGIGKTIALRLLGAGYRVICFSRSELGFNTTNNVNPDLIWEKVDITDLLQLENFVSTQYQKWGHFDGLINNAAVNHDGILSSMPSSFIDEMITINIRATLALTGLVTKKMLIHRSGSIINIGSIVGGKRGYKGSVAYSATKSALNGLTVSLARELGSMNIRVNTVLPGFVETDMTSEMEFKKKQQIIRRTPMKRFATADDIADCVLFFLSSQSSFITGQLLAVDGGLTC